MAATLQVQGRDSLFDDARHPSLQKLTEFCKELREVLLSWTLEFEIIHDVLLTWMLELQELHGIQLIWTLELQELRKLARSISGQRWRNTPTQN